MNHQATKAPRKVETHRQNSRARRRTCEIQHLVFFLSASLCLGVMVVNVAFAQVASHAPTTISAQPAANGISQPVGRVVVRVNGAALTDRDLLREMFSIFPYARVHNGFPPEMEAGIRDGAMKMMIFEELVYQEAKRRNMSIPPTELTRAQMEFRRQFTSPQQYQDFLRNEFKSSDSLLRVKVERSLLIDKLLKQEVADRAVVSEADTRAYYDQHPDRFRASESFSFQSISILPPPNANDSQTQEARRRAGDALRQAKATKNYNDFGLLAEKISEDDFHVMMGDHQAADRSKLPPAVVNTLLAMQPGQVSDLIEFAPGDFTILRLVSHNPAGMQKFESVKATLYQQLLKDKNEQLRSALSAKLSKNAKIVKA